MSAQGGLRRRWAGPAVVLLGAMLVSACGIIPRRDPPRPVSVYVLQWDRGEPAPTADGCAALRVDPPKPAPGFLTSRMIYMRGAHRLEQFAWSRWADTPTAMLEPLMLAALQKSGAFPAVLAPPSPVDHNLTLIVENVRLLQKIDESASEIELSADVRLFQPGARRLLGSDRLIVTEPAQATPADGVAAANRAVDVFLDRLVEFAVTGAARADGLCPGS